MGLAIFIGELEWDDGDASIKLIETKPWLLGQHQDSRYANYWGMSYGAQGFACQKFPWFKEAIGLETYSEPKPLITIPPPYGTFDPEWGYFVNWFTFWRNYALSNLKDPVIRLS